MSGPQIQLCLFTFRRIVSKQLNGLTTIDTFSWLGGAVVTHPLWVQEVLDSIPDSGKGFKNNYRMFDFLFCCFCVFTFCPKTHYLSQKSVFSFAMLIYFVYLTYFKICDRLKVYKETDLASLNSLTTIDNLSFLGYAEVRHLLWVWEVPGSIPGSGKVKLEVVQGSKDHSCVVLSNECQSNVLAF